VGVYGGQILDKASSACPCAYRNSRMTDNRKMEKPTAFKPSSKYKMLISNPLVGGWRIFFIPFYLIGGH